VLPPLLFTVDPFHPHNTTARSSSCALRRLHHHQCLPVAKQTILAEQFIVPLDCARGVVRFTLLFGIRFAVIGVNDNTVNLDADDAATLPLASRRYSRHSITRISSPTHQCPMPACCQ